MRDETQFCDRHKFCDRQQSWIRHASAHIYHTHNGHFRKWECHPPCVKVHNLSGSFAVVLCGLVHLVSEKFVWHVLLFCAQSFAPAEGTTCNKHHRKLTFLNVSYIEQFPFWLLYVELAAKGGRKRSNTRFFTITGLANRTSSNNPTLASCMTQHYSSQPSSQSSM